MSSVDIEQLLTPILDDNPAGDDLEYDPDFGALVLAAQRKPEQRMGDQIIPAEEPDWMDVYEKSTALFARTKDYRVAVNLTNSAFQKEGFEALADGLSIVRLLSEQFWDSAYPQLDAEDNNDPSYRVNALIALNDTNGTLGLVRSTPIVLSRAVGKFSLGDYEHAQNGSGNTEDGESDAAAPQLSLIDAAFMDADIDELQATEAAVNRALEEVSAVTALFDDRVGSMDSPDLSPLIQELRQADNLLVDHLARRGVGDGVEAADSEVQAASSGGAISGQIASREDVLLMLDKICDYFVANEPSSPVPLLLRRAKRLVAADFMEILRDMTPDGLRQAESIGGISDSNE